jgi:flagellar hook-associated protein FlgK
LKATIEGKECQTYRLFSDRRTLNEVHEKAVLKEENLIKNFETKVFNIKRGIEKLLQEKDEIDTKLKSGVIKCNKLIGEIREINLEINKS